MRKKVLLWGTSENCLARYAGNLDLSQVEVMAFIDSDISKKGSYIKKGKNYSSSQWRYEYWPIESVQIITPNQIKEVAYDYLLIGSFEFADEIYEGIQKSDDMEIPQDKILIVLEDLYHYVFYGINKYGNNSENSIIFKNNYYDLIVKYNEMIREGMDEEKNQIQLKDLIYPLDVFMREKKTTWYEMNDILQEYAFGDENKFSYIEGPYEYGNVKIEEEDVIFDCGANIGVFSVLASVKANKGKVYAFEPVPEICELLTRTSENYHNIEVYELALSNQIGNTTMCCNSSMLGSAIALNGEGELVVRMDTIDHFVEEHKLKRIDFIKADIEGAERYMLEGAKETMKNFAPKLSICTYHLADDKEVLEKIIRDANPNYVIEHQWKKLFAYVL